MIAKMIERGPATPSATTPAKATATTPAMVLPAGAWRPAGSLLSFNASAADTLRRRAHLKAPRDKSCRGDFGDVRDIDNAPGGATPPRPASIRQARAG